ncbi:hypothetical protein [Streptomyces sp. 061-3]|uniref:hypothetical protein n=1 Tax=Streptomyces sp. 061-3 TaxID=2789268 RepID=UPI00397EB02A
MDASSPARVDAHALAKRVTLTPADWGAAYKQADPYEQATSTAGVTNNSCKYEGKAIVNSLGGLERDVTTPDQTTAVTSTLVVYKDPASAHDAITQFRTGTERCRTVSATASKAQWKDVHEVKIPKKGFDEVATEEAHQVLDDAGQATDVYYTLAYGRKGQYLMEAYVARGGTQEQNRDEAVTALLLMLSRL